MSPWIAITPSVISVVGLIIAGAMAKGASLPRYVKGEHYGYLKRI